MTVSIAALEKLAFREPITGERATRVFYSCKRQGCRRREVVPAVVAFEKRYKGYGRYEHVRLFLVERADEVYFALGIPLRLCSCGRYMDANVLRGTKSDTPCDARCTSATGHNCECSCAGKNHGSDA